MTIQIGAYRFTRASLERGEVTVCYSTGRPQLINDEDRVALRALLETESERLARKQQDYLRRAKK